LSKHHEKQRRKTRRSTETAQVFDLNGSKFETERSLPPIKPLNATQDDYLDALKRNSQVVVLGPAGTGKTWIAATHAADLFRQRRIRKIPRNRRLRKSRPPAGLSRRMPVPSAIIFSRHSRCSTTSASRRIWSW